MSAGNPNVNVNPHKLISASDVVEEPRLTLKIPEADRGMWGLGHGAAGPRRQDQADGGELPQERAGEPGLSWFGSSGVY